VPDAEEQLFSLGQDQQDAAADASTPPAPEPPAPVQLRLFPAPRPLVERLGAEFFRGAPQQPGVYCLHDASGRIIYVGKAKNLRRRLGSYRYTERASRKTARLIHCAHKITWEVCVSEPEARLRENSLLRRHRPRFNRLNTYPLAYFFIQVAPFSGGFRMILTRLSGREAFPAEPAGLGAGPIVGAPQAETGASAVPVGVTCGAFKSGAKSGFLALLRVLWAAIHRPASWTDLPRTLLLDDPPRQFDFFCADAAWWSEQVCQFLAGAPEALCHRLADRLGRCRHPFGLQLLKVDWTTLKEFYLRGPRRNRQLCAMTGRASTLIPQEELDDLLVLAQSQAAQ
jgi:hypothetical protein